MIEVSLMGAIAEGFIFGLSAPAKRHDRPAGKPVGFTLHVYDLEVPFHFERPIVINGYFS